MQRGGDRLSGAAIVDACGCPTNAMSPPASSWLFHATDPAPPSTLAGWWAVAISAPVFYFLLFRGIWRYLVWAMLIWNIASLELRLVASHPDGKAGLAFVAEYPNAYAMYVFGLSSAAAIAVVRHVFENGVAPTTFGYIIGGWLAIVLAFFGFPLLAFSGPLSQLRELSLQILGAQATLFHRQAERTLIGQNVAATQSIPNSPNVFFSISQALLTDEISGSCQKFLAHLLMWAGTRGFCWWSVPRMAEFFKVSDRTVQKWQNQLTRAGLLKIVPRYWQSNLLFPLPDRASQEMPVVEPISEGVNDIGSPIKEREPKKKRSPVAGPVDNPDREPSAAVANVFEQTPSCEPVEPEVIEETSPEQIPPEPSPPITDRTRRVLP